MMSKSRSDLRFLTPIDSNDIRSDLFFFKHRLILMILRYLRYYKRIHISLLNFSWNVRIYIEQGSGTYFNLWS